MNAIETFGHFALGSHTPQREVGLAEAASAFEGLMVGSIQRAAAKPMGGEHPLDGGSAGRMYREMWLQELSALATRDGIFGLEKLLASSTQGGPIE